MCHRIPSTDAGLVVTRARKHSPSVIFFWTDLSVGLQWPVLFNTEIFLSSTDFLLFSSNSFHVMMYLCQPTLSVWAPLDSKHDTRQGEPYSPLRLLSLSLRQIRCQQPCQQTPSPVLNSQPQACHSSAMALSIIFEVSSHVSLSLLIVNSNEGREFWFAHNKYYWI